MTIATDTDFDDLSIDFTNRFDILVAVHAPKLASDLAAVDIARDHASAVVAHIDDLETREREFCILYSLLRRHLDDLEVWKVHHIQDLPALSLDDSNGG